VNNAFGKNLIFWLAIALLLIFLFNVFQGGPQSPTATGVQNVAYSDFMADAKSGRISNVTIQGQTLFGNFRIPARLSPRWCRLMKMSSSACRVPACRSWPRGP
jgi:ATP-dependent Zn protease